MTAARLSWGQSSSPATLSDERSFSWPVPADGGLRTYLIDLRRVGGWPRHLPEHLRLDPMDQPGEFEVALIALLGSSPIQLARQTRVDVRASLARRFLRGDGIEIGALQNPLPLPAEAKVTYVDRLSRAEARAHYPELDGQPLVEPEILAEADRLIPIASESQDFVVCNHVLEHLRDPIGALHEWLRVLKPRGLLYVSIPDHRNPLDARRAVTSFEHLLHDYQKGGDRSAEDREHYWDWTRSAHASMSPEEQARHTESLIAKSYAIHFHTFNMALFEHTLDFLHRSAGAEVVELLPNSLGDYLEYIAIVRKT
jgi:SAM-dependent methyltransferase